jgi:hypothetical protein
MIPNTFQSKLNSKTTLDKNNPMHSNNHFISNSESSQSPKIRSILGNTASSSNNDPNFLISKCIQMDIETTQSKNHYKIKGFGEMIKPSQETKRKTFRQFKENNEKLILDQSNKTKSNAVLNKTTSIKRASGILTRLNVQKDTNLRSKSISPFETDVNFYFQKAHLQNVNKDFSAIGKSKAQAEEIPYKNVQNRSSNNQKLNFNSTDYNFYSKHILDIANCTSYSNFQNSKDLAKRSSTINLNSTTKEGSRARNNRSVYLSTADVSKLPDFQGAKAVNPSKEDNFPVEKPDKCASKVTSLPENALIAYFNFEKDIHRCQTDSIKQKLDKERSSSPKENDKIFIKGVLGKKFLQDLHRPQISSSINSDLQKIYLNNQRIYNKAKNIVK